ncbi:MAG: M14 family metallopeptidase [Candidatus Aminicenantes bacterium]|nr:M14 family metallopeptidase [Candidatus Aminicenantes bacterium]
MKYLHRGFVLVLLLALLTGFPLKAADDASTGYHNFQALTQALKNIVGKNTKIAQLQSIGKSLQGRDLWMVQVSGTQGGAPEDKQALLVVGNLEGDHVVGSEVALGMVEYLINGYGSDEKVTEILNKRTFYIAPRMNPDGAEAFFSTTKIEHSGNFKPRDEDYDWVIDEDGPDDLNGDGLITQMRVKDKEGDWMIDESDPRLMKKKESDTPLDKLYAVYTEGIDDDDDGLYNEDGPGGFNINRNFPHNFGYDIKGWGVYAVSEAETEALIDFMAKYDPSFKGQPHRNICAVLSFSKFDNLAAGTGIESGTPTFPQPPQAAQASGGGGMMMFMRGGGGGGRGQAAEAPTARPTDPQPKATVGQDQSLFKAVSDQYKSITKINSAVSEKPFGSFLEYAYFQFGVPSFSANLWSVREDAPARPAAMRTAEAGQAPPPSMDRGAMMQRARGGGAGSTAAASNGSDGKWLKWIDDENEGNGFVNWTKVNHKQLGEVEVGGFVPYVRVNPAADMIPDLSKSHAEFALYLASQFAEITMDDPLVEKLSSNLYRLKIKVHNNGEFPYVTAMGTRTRNITAMMLKLKFENENDMKLFGGNQRVDISSLASGAEQEFTWTIISPPGKQIDITLWARNGGGTTQKKVVLK